MWKALMLAITIVLSTPSFAGQYVPNDGEAVRIFMYCTSVADFQAYILSGAEDPIPDEFDCWVPAFPTMGIFNGDARGFVENNDVQWDIHRIDPTYYINHMGILDEFPVDVFIGIPRENSGA